MGFFSLLIKSKSSTFYFIKLYKIQRVISWILLRRFQSKDCGTRFYYFFEFPVNRVTLEQNQHGDYFQKSRYPNIVPLTIMKCKKDKIESIQHFKFVYLILIISRSLLSKSLQCMCVYTIYVMYIFGLGGLYTTIQPRDQCFFVRCRIPRSARRTRRVQDRRHGVPPEEFDRGRKTLVEAVILLYIA